MYFYLKKVNNRFNIFFVMKYFSIILKHYFILDSLSEKFNLKQEFKKWLKIGKITDYNKIVFIVNEYEMKRSINYVSLMKQIFIN